jgi:hypothetical protein
LEIRYLPPYSPDLNPVERVWWYMRKHITHNRYLSNLKERIARFWKLMPAKLKPDDVLKKIIMNQKLIYTKSKPQWARSCSQRTLCLCAPCVFFANFVVKDCIN